MGDWKWWVIMAVGAYLVVGAFLQGDECAELTGYEHQMCTEERRIESTGVNGR